MCTGLEPMLLAGLAGGAALSSVMAPKMPTPNIPAPEKPPQTTKAPQRAPAAPNAAATGAGVAGNGGTFLTGASGVDPSALTLGRNTLLGQ